MKRLRKPMLVLIPGIGLGIFLSMTNPYEIPLAALLIPFGLLFWLAYVTSRYLLMLILHQEEKDAKTTTQTSQNISRSSAAAILASIIVLVTVLQSIQQLTTRDILLTIGLLSLTVFYIKRLA